MVNKKKKNKVCAPRYKNMLIFIAYTHTSVSISVTFLSLSSIYLSSICVYIQRESSNKGEGTSPSDIRLSYKGKFLSVTLIHLPEPLKSGTP